MRNSFWILLVPVFVGPVYGGEATVSSSGDTQVAELPDARETTLNMMIDQSIDFSDMGDVALLSSGEIVLRHTDVLVLDGGRTLDIPTENAVLSLPNAPAMEGALVAIASYHKVPFDLTWNSPTSGVVTIYAENANVQLEFTTLSPTAKKGPTCSVPDGTCGNTSCVQTCKPFQACTAYCDDGTAVCFCSPKPKKKKEVLLQFSCP